ncbi:MAG: AAA family ATPase [Proteobacteria bacterium]|nr:AAA family ATPase [Pseudomonadota bacterium]
MKATTIAIAGKGGVGKTLTAGLLVRHLADKAGPVLAVDADANANLNEVLGIEQGESVGTVREEMKRLAGQMPGGMTKPEFIEYKVETSLSESEHFDLLVMGRPEGPGCYCYANNLLRDVLVRVCRRYRYVIVDNEAGMEHLSRRLMQDLDLLLIISDPTIRGLKTALRLSQVPEEVQTRVAKKLLVVNRVRNGLSPEAQQLIDDSQLQLLGTIDEDPQVTRYDASPGELCALFPDSNMARAVAHLIGGYLSSEDHR